MQYNITIKYFTRRSPAVSSLKSDTPVNYDIFLSIVEVSRLTYTCVEQFQELLANQCRVWAN